MLVYVKSSIIRLVGSYVVILVCIGCVYHSLFSFRSHVSHFVFEFLCVAFYAVKM